MHNYHGLVLKNLKATINGKGKFKKVTVQFFTTGRRFQVELKKFQSFNNDSFIKSFKHNLNGLNSWASSNKFRAWWPAKLVKDHVKRSLKNIALKSGETCVLFY